MLKIKEWWVSLFIPKNSPYCHHNFKKDRNGRPYAKPCRYFDVISNPDGEPIEYCKYLKQILDIQDQVKDCGINDYKVEKID